MPRSQRPLGPDDADALRELYQTRARQPEHRNGGRYARVPAGDHGLSGPELRALRAISHGLEPAEAAVVLGYTVWGIREQLDNARRLLRAKNNAHAVAEALRRGLIP